MGAILHKVFKWFLTLAYLIVLVSVFYIFNLGPIFVNPGALLLFGPFALIIYLFPVTVYVFWLKPFLYWRMITYEDFEKVDI